MYEIAIIILNYNSVSDCRKCVSFLKSQKGVKLDIILVDNSSQTHEVKKAKQLADEQGCTFIAANKNRGYNAGNNIGLRYAASKGYKYALIANPDMEFPQNSYVAKLVAVMEQKPDVVVCSSDIVTPKGIHQNPMKCDGNWKSSFGWITCFFNPKSNNTYEFIDNYAESHYCSKVSGCCFLVRLAFVSSIGYFDEGVFLYCEEAILSKQVEHEGQKMYYDASSQAIHHHVKGEKGTPIPRFRNWITSRLYFELTYNYQGLWQHWLKVIGWKSYLAMFIIYYKIAK